MLTLKKSLGWTNTILIGKKKRNLFWKLPNNHLTFLGGFRLIWPGPDNDALHGNWSMNEFFMLVRTSMLILIQLWVPKIIAFIKINVVATQILKKSLYSIKMLSFSQIYTSLRLVRTMYNREKKISLNYWKVAYSQNSFKDSFTFSPWVLRSKSVCDWWFFRC